MITERTTSIESSNLKLNYNRLNEVIDSLDQEQQIYLKKTLNTELSSIQMTPKIIIELFDVLNTKQQWSLINKFEQFNLSIDDYIEVFPMLDKSQQAYVFEQIRPRLAKLLGPVNDLIHICDL
ncbi:hypothetical protein L3V82_07440 [Thiotrichales bacterium 19S3-7]|nr:hypothetical protein [Thiotrichales bacterium 19S3-7]MCF6801990.1 hypothetical protein [Thiotrichales bacterium 19S3-11]